MKRAIAFLPAHPSQLWIMRALAPAVQEFAHVVWVIRDKDGSAALARDLGLSFQTISTARTGLAGNAWELLANIPKAIGITRRKRVDLWFTKYGAGNVAAWLLGRKTVSFNDDDIDVVPLIACTSYPFAHSILAPSCVRMGRFEKKVERYRGYHELFYLHPNRFRPDPGVLRELGLGEGEKFGILRLSGLQSHHDVGVEGMSAELVRQIIRDFAPEYRLFITSERPLDPEFEPFRIAIPRTRIHHALAYADFFAGDSQTMTAEAAVLGTPAFRINDFVGRISYLEELDSFGLSHGFRRDQSAEMLSRMKAVLGEPNVRSTFERRRRQMLDQKCDPVPFVAERLRALIEES